MPRGVPTSGARVSRTHERRAFRPSVIDPHQLYDIAEVAACRGRSIAATWADIRDGKIKSTKIGNRRLVIGAEIIRANMRDAGEPVEVIDTEASSAANDE